MEFIATIVLFILVTLSVAGNIVLAVIWKEQVKTKRENERPVRTVAPSVEAIGGYFRIMEQEKGNNDKYDPDPNKSYWDKADNGCACLAESGVSL